MRSKILPALFLIIVVASILRLWQLGNVPISPDWDEVALGYNAYSLLSTGKDEYGKSLPIVLQSFDDYKPALYAYLIIPFIKVFGLDIISVRLPSALFGILTVLATYFLVKEITKKDNVALLSAFLLAISPWHIQFSRIAFESNVGLAFNVLGALFFLKGLRNHKLLWVSVVFFASNIYAYQNEKIFSPLLLLLLVILFREQLFLVSRRVLISAIVVGLIIILPFISFSLSNPKALGRAQSVSIFSNTASLLQSTIDKISVDQKTGDNLGTLLDNRRIIYAKTIASNYLANYDFNWLFIRGDAPRHHAPNVGLLYIWELPFLLIGLYIFIFTKALDKKYKLFVLLWFLFVPVPASISPQVPHAVRTLNFLPTFQIFTAFGILQSIAFMKGNNTLNKYALFAYIVFACFIGGNIIYYLNQYFVQQNYFHAKDWQYGYKEVVSQVSALEPEYDKVVIENRTPMDQSYIFFLFYQKYPPVLYQKENRKPSYGKYEFRQINWSLEKQSRDTLYVGFPDGFPSSVKPLKVIYYPNRDPAMYIIEGSA